MAEKSITELRIALQQIGHRAAGASKSWAKAAELQREIAVQLGVLRAVHLLGDHQVSGYMGSIADDCDTWRALYPNAQAAGEGTEIQMHSMKLAGRIVERIVKLLKTLDDMRLW